MFNITNVTKTSPSITWKDLPNDTLLCIFSFLDAKELAQSSRVSSQWYQSLLIEKNQTTFDQHIKMIAMRLLFKQHPISFDSKYPIHMYALIDACYTRIAYIKQYGKTILYNPLTGLRRKIADPTFPEIHSQFLKIHENKMIVGDWRGVLRIFNIPQSEMDEKEFEENKPIRQLKVKSPLSYYGYDEKTGIAIGYGKDRKFVVIEPNKPNYEFFLRIPSKVESINCDLLTLQSKQVSIAGSCVLTNSEKKYGCLQSYSLETKALQYMNTYFNKPLHMVSNATHISLGFEYGNVLILNALNGVQVKKLPIPPLSRIEFLHMDNSRLFTGLNTGLTQIWKASTGDLLHSFPPNTTCKYLKYISTYKDLLAIAMGREIEIWDMNTWSKLQTAKFLNTSGCINRISFKADQDEAYLVARDTIGNFCIWHPNAKPPLDLYDEDEEDDDLNIPSSSQPCLEDHDTQKKFCCFNLT